MDLCAQNQRQPET
ncbi:Protein of unknown function [Gryllus bimaculatus]|nr:Protein of unknown function [Gryllus bimaculatus]